MPDFVRSVPTGDDREREHTGEGRWVQTSLLEAAKFAGVLVPPGDPAALAHAASSS